MRNLFLTCTLPPSNQHSIHQFQLCHGRGCCPHCRLLHHHHHHIHQHHPRRHCAWCSWIVAHSRVWCAFISINGWRVPIGSCNHLFRRIFHLAPGHTDSLVSASNGLNKPSDAHDISWSWLWLWPTFRPSLPILWTLAKSLMVVPG